MSFMLLSEHSIKLTPNVFVLVDDQRRDPLLVKIQKVKDWGMNTHCPPHQDSGIIVEEWTER